MKFKTSLNVVSNLQPQIAIFIIIMIFNVAKYVYGSTYLNTFAFMTENHQHIENFKPQNFPQNVEKRFLNFPLFSV